MKQRVEAIVRLIVALVPVINIVLVSFEKSPLPFTSDEVNAGLSAVVSVLAIIWAWWKNNNMTDAAQMAQDDFIAYKINKNKVGGEGDPLEVQ